MYLDLTVPIPKVPGKIYVKNLKGTDYVSYEYGREYKPEKKYNIPKRTTIGKVVVEDRTMMYPNPNFLKFFPDADIPEEKNSSKRSSCLQIGTWLVIRKIIEEQDLRGLLMKQFGAKDLGLFLDLAAYTIISENNAGQYYPDYAYHHPLFTERMRIYSDTKVSEFLKSIDDDERVGFLNSWNEIRDHRERIYISYDSTNKACQSGDISMAEFGHAKDDDGEPIINYSIAYDKTNREPLFYEDYPGSIVDISQLQYMLEKAKGYGYKNIGFILDRGYFSEPNIHYMDKCHYQFVIMVKGMADFIQGLVLDNKGKFEDDRRKSIRRFHVYGTTVRKTLYPADENERYFHIYYSSSKNSAEREQLEEKLDRMEKTLSKLKNRKDVELSPAFLKYYEPVVSKDGAFLYGMERKDVVENELKLCGYFVIITSESMTALDALELYKSRDASEKLFRGDKSYLGNRTFRSGSEISAESKIFIEFVALIIRNRIYTKLKDAMEEEGQQNYMTVPAAIRELEKIEMIRLMDKVYRMDHAVTATQKTILKAFDIDSAYIRKATQELSGMLAQVDGEEQGV